MEKLVKVLENFSKKELDLLESLDRQYLALQRLYSSLGEPELFLKLVVVNALMSYQLQMKGEKYWETFGEYFSENPGLENFRQFIEAFNRRFLNAKLKRLEKVLRCVEGLFQRYSLEELGDDLKSMVSELARCLGQKPESKTVVFAAKMFMYGYRIAFGRDPSNGEEIDIPLDSRLSKISPRREFWRELSRRTGIPQIRLDGVIWITMGLEGGGLEGLPEGLREKVSELSRVISEYLD